MDDPNCDGVLAILTPQAMSYPTQTAEALIEVARRHPRKPCSPRSWARSRWPKVSRRAVRPTCRPSTRPRTRCAPTCTCTSTPRACRSSTRRRPTSCRSFNPDRDEGQGIFVEVARQQRITLSEIEAKDVLEAYGMPTVKTVLATTAEECAKLAERDRLSGRHQDPLARHHPQVRRGRHRAQRALGARSGQAVQQDHGARDARRSPRPRSWAWPCRPCRAAATR